MAETLRDIALELLSDWKESEGELINNRGTQSDRDLFEHNIAEYKRRIEAASITDPSKEVFDQQVDDFIQNTHKEHQRMKEENRKENERIKQSIEESQQRMKERGENRRLI